MPDSQMTFEEHIVCAEVWIDEVQDWVEIGTVKLNSNIVSVDMPRELLINGTVYKVDHS